MAQNQGTGNKPEKKFSVGAISATVWKNSALSKDKEPVEYSTISFDRRYKDKAGNWQSTNHLRTGDLPKAILVLNKAYEFLVLRDQESSSQSEVFDEEEII